MTDRSDEQDDEDDEDDEGPVDEYDAEFFGDSKDRAELMAMSEVDREQILFERAKKVKRRAVSPCCLYRPVLGGFFPFFWIMFFPADAWIANLVTVSYCDPLLA